MTDADYVTIYVGSTTRIYVTGFTDDEGTVVSNATGTYQVTDSQGAVVTSGDLTASGSAGYYYAILSAAITAALTGGATYYITYTLTHATGAAVFTDTAIATVRS